MLQEAPCGFPPVILDRMVRPKLERVGVQFSPSSIQSCHRKYSLQREHDWYIDPKKEYAWVRGTMFHSGLAKEAGDFVVPGTLGVIRELRMFAPIETHYGLRRFSGQVDEIMLLSQEPSGTLHVRISDWKSKGDIPHSLIEAEIDHIYQVNEYMWLVEEILKEYIEHWDELANPNAEFILKDGVELLPITKVVVEELQIVYIGVSKTRTFTSRREGHTEGKMVGEIGTDGKWHRKYPIEHEKLELGQIYMYSHEGIENIIRKGIEEQIEGQAHLAPPLTEERARNECPWCSMKEQCILVGKAQGLDMSIQERL